MTWEFKGLIGDEPRPALVCSRAGVCLIMGSGWSLWQDVKDFFSLIGQYFENKRNFKPEIQTMAVNFAGLHFKPKLNHIVSQHDEILSPIVYLHNIHRPNFSPCITHSNNRSNRRNQELPKTEFSEIPVTGADYYWHLKGFKAGTSSFLAIGIALALGYSKIVLAGIPLDSKGYFYDDCKTDSFASRFVIDPWHNAKNSWMKNHIRSMSGRTKKIFGEPSKDWLKG